jgi:hypothetical protein
MLRVYEGNIDEIKFELAAHATGHIESVSGSIAKTRDFISATRAELWLTKMCPISAWLRGAVRRLLA